MALLFPLSCGRNPVPAANKNPRGCLTGSPLGNQKEELKESKWILSLCQQLAQALGRLTGAGLVAEGSQAEKVLAVGAKALARRADDMGVLK